ncbi:putative DnaJ domain, Chaperone J-domain superfamily [Helianthus annuus]|nr:putative DnaJ domain, Chaperone J-domain superfamily [Helianthus annuus]KAJ0516682.1 putative DnaJ domain, Chaperone J-domain superfamily [Helianthus annuus]KAJ0684684.1 putative DnaJ domain, Chaperone J-domain superfamily [Helianthus annuus]
MDPHSFIARAEAQRWLGIAEKLLMGNDLVGSKTFAIRARESDPRLEAADQILAVADTLLAADKRVVGANGSQQPDFYAILQLVRFVQDPEHISAQYRRLAVLLNPHQNRFPYADQAFQVVNDAWAVLSNPMRKSIYDSDLEFSQHQQQVNNLGFNIIEPQNQHHHHQQQHQQQHQHNFFSVNRNEQEMFQSRVPVQSVHHHQEQQQQQQQLHQHNFMSVPVREPEQLFQHRGHEQLLFQQQVQPFSVTVESQQQTRPAAPFSWPQAPPQVPPPPPSLSQMQHQFEGLCGMRAALPPIYIDDETDDIFDGISEPSDDSDSDLEWNTTEKKKAKKMKKDRVKEARNGNTKNGSSLRSSRKSSGVTTRRQSVRAAKEMGRLDLNVEFNNNEGEEPAARAGAGNRGNGQGDGDNIEGIGFFEGLDEFFSSLPILSVVNDDKVKAA